MAGAVVEVKYFNTFVLKKIINAANLPQDIPIWNGSLGIPYAKGGYPRVSDTSAPENWAIEESRIRGGYNNLSVDLGVRAYLVEEEPNAVTRYNSLIYSDIFNSRTGINNTNVFSVGKDIIKSTDPANGSIQRLYAEDTNMFVFQENKISRALIDKDAIYSAEGGGAVTSSNLTIGVIQPLPGRYGISKNPESFAVFGYNKYFSDKNNNVMLRLSGQGLGEISTIGMRDYFRDEMNSIDTVGFTGFIRGGYDIYNGQYVVSTQQDSINIGPTASFNTVSFDETIQGWTSFYDYRPMQLFGLKNNFYTVEDNIGLWKHYSTDVPRASFYGTTYRSSITFVFNPEPNRSKTFKTISYEGSNGWEVTSIVSDETGKGLSPATSLWGNSTDQAAQIRSYVGGEYIMTTGSGTTVAASAVITVTLTSVVGVIPVGAPVTGVGVTAGTTVVSYNTGTGVLTVNQILGVALGAVLTFDYTIPRTLYNTALGTTQPSFPRYHAGLDRKENSYVSNLINASAATESEILFGQEMSGIKGYFVTTTLTNDTVTDEKGEKQLFSVSSEYAYNNGY